MGGGMDVELVESTFSPLVKRKVAGVVAGVVRGDDRLVKSFGVSGTNRSLAPDSVFEIGSITKTFTAVLLADMAERGELTLEDPIGAYLPSDVTTPSKGGRAIELLDLATHTAGLPSVPRNMIPHLLRNRSNPYSDYSRSEFYGGVGKARIKRSIGKKFRYSNLGFGLLGHVLELAAGESYEKLVIERVCFPLSMPDTSIGIGTRVRPQLVQGHRGKKPVPAWDLPAFAGAGALRSSVSDMLSFLQAHLEPHNTSLAPALLTVQEPRRPIKIGQLEVCLAWLRSKNKSGNWVTWHNGGTGGFASFAGFSREAGVGLVVLSNSRMSMGLNASSMRLLDSLIA